LAKDYPKLMNERPNIPDIASLVQKAVYLGIGIADYAAEKARVNIKEIREQAFKLADEMVERGEMSVEEARKYVDEIIQQAQQHQVQQSEDNTSKEPRLIEIIAEEEEEPPKSKQVEEVEDLRKQLESLQEELRNLKKN
jgi:polyhydroxyalkanoate synthesis regulator phasin